MSFGEQIISKDKYLIIFSPQIKAIVFISLQIFFATRPVLKIGEYLTIRPVARKGYSPMALEDEGSNCFSITQLVGQKTQ